MNQAVDMSRFVVAKSDQLNADDLIGGPRTITVSRVRADESSSEQPIVIHYDGEDGRPFKPCKTMRRLLMHFWGPDASKYPGRSMTLYRDAKVQFGGLQVGGIRISHLSDIPPDKLSGGKAQVALMVTRGRKAPFEVRPLENAPRQGTQSGADNEREWTDKFIGNVNRAPDAEKLDAFVSGKSGLLDQLKANRPELHRECEGAIAARRAALSPADAFADDEEEDPFGLPPLDDGISDDWRAKGDELLSSIEKAATDGDLDAAQDEYVAVCTEMPKPLADRIEASLAAKRKELAGGEKGE